MSATIPIVLFAYARPSHLHKTLEALRVNEPPLIYAFSDGPGTPQVVPEVVAVREMLRAVDWCDMIVTEREHNMGLGKSILEGVTEILRQHAAVLVFEDDIVCVPGAYRYLCEALAHYADDPSVMSVTGWTHPRVIPAGAGQLPYFDGRAECWLWGTWPRAWHGMERDALSLMRSCRERGVDVYRYGADLPRMARLEHSRNIWAVRWTYLHILHGGLCMRPPYSLVRNIGFDAQATHTSDQGEWRSVCLNSCPSIPNQWPAAVENPECPGLWRNVYGTGRVDHFFKKLQYFTASRCRGVCASVRSIFSNTF